MNITDKIAAESLIALTAIFSSFAGISGVDIYYTLLLLFNLQKEQANLISNFSIVPISLLILSYNFFKKNKENCQVPLIPYDLIYILTLNLIFGFQVSKYIKQYIPYYLQLIISSIIFLVSSITQFIRVLKQKKQNQEIKQQMIISQLISSTVSNKSSPVVEMRQRKGFSHYFSHLKFISKNRTGIFVTSIILSIAFYLCQTFISALNLIQLSISIMYQQISVIYNFNNKQIVLFGMSDEYITNQTFTYISYYSIFAGFISGLIDISPSVMIMPLLFKYKLQQKEIYACTNILMLINCIIDLSQAKFVMSSLLFITAALVSTFYLLSFVVAIKLIKKHKVTMLRLTYCLLLLVGSGTCLYASIRQLKQNTVKQIFFM